MKLEMDNMNMDKSLVKLVGEIDKEIDKLEKKKRQSKTDKQKLTILYLAKNQVGFARLGWETTKALSSITNILKGVSENFKLILLLIGLAMFKNEIIVMNKAILKWLASYIYGGIQGFKKLPFEDQYNFKYGIIPTLLLTVLAIPTVLLLIRKIVEKLKSLVSR